INAQTEKHYIESKVAYHNPKELINYRRDGWGIRTLFIALLDYIKDNNLETKTLGEINDEFRASLIHDLPTKEHDLTPETINS
ncbi:MAG: hypothetical protein KC618_02310, partial [Candidatus Omnitrophica bacterium]|nr:hypothetical protein [Candidatus Omnitrophota bacterium]